MKNRENSHSAPISPSDCSTLITFLFPGFIPKIDLILIQNIFKTLEGVENTQNMRVRLLSVRLFNKYM